MMTMTTKKTYNVLTSIRETGVTATGYRVTEGDLYLYDDSRKDDDPVAMFPAGHWVSITEADHEQYSTDPMD